MTPEEQLAYGRELLQHARARDLRFEEGALEAERDGDTEGTWFAMASRAENRRFIARLERDLKDLEEKMKRDKK